MKTFKIWQVLAVLTLVILVMLGVYGLRNDCPNTAGYVFCGASDHGSLHR